MAVKDVIKKGEYFDSVTLMTVSKKLGALPGVEDCSVVMATGENKAILANCGLLSAQGKSAGDADLIIAVKADGESAALSAIKEAEALLKKGVSAQVKGRSAVRSLDAALKTLPGANMALISVAGRYAAGVASDALDNGLNVMLFSDNVSIEDELALKLRAHKAGLIVMGPDCGTAIINGVPLAFANAVGRGSVGIISAAGTGLQEVSSLLSNLGAGVSQAIGTGGRDVKKEIGGISFLDGLAALAGDAATKVIVLIAKPPHPEVLRKIAAATAKIKKPMVGIFIGGKPELPGVRACATLEEAAQCAAALASGGKCPEPRADCDAKKLAASEAALHRKSGGKYVRGLYSGGTFVGEAQMILSPLLGRVLSNAPVAAQFKLKDALKSEGHCVVDLGEDEFTVGRPHPMIDYSLRNRRIIEEAADPETAVILFDVVIGYGANLRPVEDISPALSGALKTARKAGRHLSLVCSVTGTENDPQRRSAVVAGLERAGAAVMPSNAAACRLAGAIAKALEK